MTENKNVENSASEAKPRIAWTKLVVLGLVALVIAIAYFQFGDTLSPAGLAKRESELRQYQSAHPLLVYGIALIAYVVVTGFSLPGAAGMTLIYGWYFGFWHGVPLVSFGSTAGATVAFLLSRYLVRETIQNRFGERLAGFNEALRRAGAFYLFTLRLIPAVPFWMINLVMGLTPIRTWTYWWVSQLGMLPATIVYVYAGSSLPNLKTFADEGIGAVLSPRQLTQIIVAFVLLGIFPLAVRKVMQRVSRTSKTKVPIE
ncbi:MAG: TVP38/TMEM64 family protein [Planctomycetota bacterium]|nr:TVP38/TMEM64 family protein [Planctomycetota bacterium]